jgi:hypothetical protein
MFEIGMSMVVGGMNFEQLLTEIYGYQGELQIGIPRGLRARRGKSGWIALWKVAFIQEYGNPSNRLFGAPAPIPARPVANTLWARRGDSYLRALRMYIFMAVRGTFPMDQALRRLSDKISNDMNLAYQTWRSPANAPYTIANKRARPGVNDPLIDTQKLAKSWEGAWAPDPAGGTAKKAFNKARAADRELRTAARGVNKASKPRRTK